jgi:hypothetical protein
VTIYGKMDIEKGYDAMTNVKKNERYIPLKNYVLAAVVVVVMILLTLYGFAWYNVLRENRVSTSYLVKEKIISNEIQSLEEVSDVFSEAPNSYFIYISYTGSEEIYNMEKDLKKVINDYSLNDSVYFLNVTSIKDEKNYIEKINKTLNLEDQKVSSIPTIIYYNEGKAVDIIERKDNNMMNVGDFQKLLDVNRVTKE